MAKKKIGDYIAQWMEELGREHPYELFRTEFVKEAGTWYLRVYVDKLEENGYGYMSSDDCETVSRFLSSKLDEEDPIEQNYYLEVSSPGLDRPLLSDKDFARFTGELIEISLYKPLEGSKSWTGTLKSFSPEEVVILTDDNKELAVPRAAAAKINLAVVF